MSMTKEELLELIDIDKENISRLQRIWFLPVDMDDEENKGKIISFLVKKIELENQLIMKLREVRKKDHQIALFKALIKGLKDTDILCEGQVYYDIAEKIVNNPEKVYLDTVENL